MSNFYGMNLWLMFFLHEVLEGNGAAFLMFLFQVTLDGECLEKVMRSINGLVGIRYVLGV